METNLVNRSAVKKKALEYATTLGKTELTRVSAEFAVRANAALDAWVKDQITNQVVNGKTIK
jgi:hypothetical protein